MANSIKSKPGEITFIFLTDFLLMSIKGSNSIEAVSSPADPNKETANASAADADFIACLRLSSKST